MSVHLYSVSPPRTELKVRLAAMRAEDMNNAVWSGLENGFEKNIETLPQAPPVVLQCSPCS